MACGGVVWCVGCGVLKRDSSHHTPKNAVGEGSNHAGAGGNQRIKFSRRKFSRPGVLFNGQKWAYVLPILFKQVPRPNPLTCRMRVLECDELNGTRATLARVCLSLVKHTRAGWAYLKVK